MGPDASEIDLDLSGDELPVQVPTWICSTRSGPRIQVAGLSKERSGGLAFDVFQIPTAMDVQNFSALESLRLRAAVEGVHDLNWQRNDNLSMRAMVAYLGIAVPAWSSWIWRGLAAPTSASWST